MIFVRGNLVQIILCKNYYEPNNCKSFHRPRTKYNFNLQGRNKGDSTGEIKGTQQEKFRGLNRRNIRDSTEEI